MQLRVRAIIPSWGSQPVNPRTLAANELFTNWPGQILPAMPRGATGAKKCYIIFRLQNMASMSLFLAQSNTEKWMTPDETMFNRELRKGYSRDKQEIQYNTLRIPKNMQHNAEYVRLFWSWVVQAFDQKRYIQQMCAWICRNVLPGDRFSRAPPVGSHRSHGGGGDTACGWERGDLAGGRGSGARVWVEMTEVQKIEVAATSRFGEQPKAGTCKAGEARGMVGF